MSTEKLKEKLMKLKVEIAKAETACESALNHVRDLKELLEKEEVRK